MNAYKYVSEIMSVIGFYSSFWILIADLFKTFKLKCMLCFLNSVPIISVTAVSKFYLIIFLFFFSAANYYGMTTIGIDN